MGDARQRAVFIWDYYKFPLLALLFLLLFLFAVFLGNAGREDVCLHAVLINNDSLIRDCDDTVFDRLLADAGIDTGRKKTEISADFSLGMSEDEYKKYLDLRRYGTTRHAGFGLGFERLVMYVTGIGNIRDAIPYPRTVGNCD